MLYLQEERSTGAATITQMKSRLLKVTLMVLTLRKKCTVVRTMAASVDRRDSYRGVVEVMVVATETVVKGATEVVARVASEAGAVEVVTKVVAESRELAQGFLQLLRVKAVKSIPIISNLKQKTLRTSSTYIK